MLGVLLADAEPEQTRPSVRDALDLVWGGLGIRLRQAPSALARAGRRDAATLLSVIAPLALLADTLRYVMEAGFPIPMARYVAAQGESWTYLFHPAPFRFLWGSPAASFCWPCRHPELEKCRGSGSASARPGG